MKKDGWFRAVKWGAGMAPAFVVILTAALIVPQLAPAAYAQACAECTISEALPPAPVSTSEWSFTKEVNEVNLFFVAMRGGKFIDDLSRSDVTVLDDKKAPAAILDFRTERELPMHVGLVIDTSNSVTSRFRFEQQGASEFLHQALRREGDQAFVMGFSDEPRVTQDLAHDPEALSEGVHKLTIGGGTALYDAVAAGCRKLRSEPERGMIARILVILSDGQNNEGTLSLDAAVDLAQQAQVVIYTISTNYHYFGDDEDFNGEEGNKNLRALAEQTGGRMLTPPTAKSVGKAFAKIAEELRSRYAIAYRPADFKADGHYRRIAIAASRQGENLKIRTRKGYYARLASLPEHAADAPASAR